MRGGVRLIRDSSQNYPKKRVCHDRSGRLESLSISHMLELRMAGKSCSYSMPSPDWSYQM